MQFKIKGNKVERWKLKEAPGGLKGPELKEPGAQVRFPGPCFSG